MKVLNQHIGDNFALYHGDCCEVIRSLPEDKMHFSIFSPPFRSLFTYSDSDRDMGNCKNDGDFDEHFQFLIPELYRITMPGRLIAIHCMDLPASLTHDGYMGFKDFSGDLIRIMQRSGFIMHSPRITIWKDPLVQAVRTKQLQLAHKQICKDSAQCAVGIPDYIVVFRKPGKNPEPVSHGRGFERYVGEMEPPKAAKNDNAKKNKYSHEVWQRYASPVWFDITQTDTLNAAIAREEKDEKHLCPLQLQTIERCLELWTNPNDTVFSPFAGIGSEGYQSIKMGRRFVGIELKESYYRQAVKNLKLVEDEPQQLEISFKEAS